MNLAIRDIQHNLGRFTLTTVGVGLLLMVVMAMGGIYRGLVEDATLLVEQLDADLWLVQHHTRGPFAEVSRVPRSLVYRAQTVPGVLAAHEFVYHTIQREYNGRPLRIAIMGVNYPDDSGQWIRLSAGRHLTQGHFEIIVDESLKVPIGALLPLGKEKFTVVGLTKNFMSLNGDGMAFVTVPDALGIQNEWAAEALRLERAARRERGRRNDQARMQPSLLENADRPVSELPAITKPQLSAVVVKLRSGARLRDVQKTMEGWSDISVFSAEGQRELLLNGIVEKTRQQIGLFQVMLTLIAGTIMALILYTLTLDKIHSIALLKLIGASNGVILGMILQQALLLGGVGYVIAYSLGSRLFPLFPRRVVLDSSDVARLGVIVLGISIGASLLGIWKALRVSPAEALS